MTFKRTYERWGLKDGEGKLRIETSGVNSTRGQGSRRAVAPSDDDDYIKCVRKSSKILVNLLQGVPCCEIS
jgi:hypothetical protein